MNSTKKISFIIAKVHTEPYRRWRLANTQNHYLTPRDVPMTDRLFEVLSSMYRVRDKTKPWVFWHTYWSRKNGKIMDGPYQDRKRFIKTLCKAAKVP